MPSQDGNSLAIESRSARTAAAKPVDAVDVEMFRKPIEVWCPKAHSSSISAKRKILEKTRNERTNEGTNERTNDRVSDRTDDGTNDGTIERNGETKEQD